MIQDQEVAADCAVWPSLGSAGLLIVPRQMAAGARPVLGRGHDSIRTKQICFPLNFIH